MMTDFQSNLDVRPRFYMTGHWLK